MESNQLVNILKKASEDYYLTGQSALSDQEYDALLAELKEQDPTNPFLSEVGTSAIKTDSKVELPVKMGSLNKIRPSDTRQITDYNKEIIVMPKYDGLSMLIEYDSKGHYTALYTRGNGTVGQLITYRGLLMNFPKHINVNAKTFIIGEAIISKKNWETVKEKSSYKVARNFVCGVLRPILSDSQFTQAGNPGSDLLPYIDIVAYDIKSDSLNFKRHDDVLKFLSDNNFIRASYDIRSPNNREDDDYFFDKDNLTDYIKRVKTNCPYATDGIVMRLNDIDVFDSLGKESNGLNPKGARAVKLEVADQNSQIGIIKDIEWNITKRGNFVPVVVLEKPLNFDGTDILKISGVNAKYVLDNGLGIGAEVQVIKSGDVIPRIIGTVIRKNYELLEVCPYCGEKLVVDSVNLVCKNESCSGKNKESVIAFFNSFDLKNVSTETISTLYDMGFNTIRKLLTIKYDELLKLKGFQASKAVNTERELNNAVKNITLAQLMYAGNTFNDSSSSLGIDRLNLIINAFGESNVLKALNNELNENGEKHKLHAGKLLEIDGIGEQCMNLFVGGYGSFKSLYTSIKDLVVFKENTFKSDKLKDMIFAFTNFRDKNLEKIITENGGQVKGISKKCTVLFSAGGESTKTQTAQKYGIKIVPSTEAKNYIENLLK